MSKLLPFLLEGFLGALIELYFKLTLCEFGLSSTFLIPNAMVHKLFEKVLIKTTFSIWAVNTVSGCSFGVIFVTHTSSTTKPDLPKHGRLVCFIYNHCWGLLRREGGKVNTNSEKL